MSNIKDRIRQEIEFLKDLNEGLYTEGDNSYYEGQDNACNHILAFIDSLPEDDIPKIEGWIARNKDGSLVFCYHKPHRENSITQEWWGSCDADFRIYDDTIDEQFKDLKWENEPREVELIIRCGTCKDSLQVHETCKENNDFFTSMEEAAKEYAYSWRKEGNKEVRELFPKTAYRAFIAGAEWQAERLKK